MGRQVHKFGFNEDIDTTTDPEDCWDAGGLYTGFVAAAAATTIVSDSVEDDTDKGGAVPGTGAFTVTVVGLDADFQEISETATMNGTAAVTLTNEFFRVYRAYVVTAGTGTTNAGNIQVKHTAVVLAQISAGKGQTLMAIYTVPKIVDSLPIGRALLREFGCSLLKSTAAGYALVSLDVREEGGAWRVRHQGGAASSGAPYSVTPKVPVSYPAGSDIRVRISEVSGNDSGVDAWFDLDLWR